MYVLCSMNTGIKNGLCRYGPNWPNDSFKSPSLRYLTLLPFLFSQSARTVAAISMAEPSLRPSPYDEREKLEQLTQPGGGAPVPCHGHGLACWNNSVSTAGISCEKGHFACAACLEKQACAVSSPALQYPASSAAHQLACEACWRASRAASFYSNATLISCVEDARKLSPAAAIAPDRDPSLVIVDDSTVEFAFVVQNILDRGMGSSDDDERTLLWQQTASIMRVERVVNSALWKGYQDVRDHISQEPYNRDRGGANEVWCKHSSGSLFPDDIWRSESGVSGIDPSYTSKGLLGRGAYFATHAAYARNYAFRGVKGAPSRQMFLVRLAAGTSEDRADGDGKRPAPSEYRHPSIGFDCVRGNVGGPGLAYVSFIQYQCYPAYLVTYCGGGL